MQNTLFLFFRVLEYNHTEQHSNTPDGIASTALSTPILYCGLPRRDYVASVGDTLKGGWKPYLKRVKAQIADWQINIEKK